MAIFEVHTRDVPLDDDVDLERLAAGTVGLTGADIRNLVNEAALWASRHDKETVDMSDFEYARDKVLMGAKRDEVLSGKEKSMTAYHESGHALLAWLVPGIDRLHKVSIIPRGRSWAPRNSCPRKTASTSAKANCTSASFSSSAGGPPSDRSGPPVDHRLRSPRRAAHLL